MNRKIIILGGGLWGSLLAYFFYLRRPELDVELYEKSDRLGGDHTWSFHSSDLPSELLPLMTPLMSYSWKKQSVFFPKRRRELDLGYHSILSSDFDQKIRDILPEAKIHLRQEVSPTDFQEYCIVFDTRNHRSEVEGAWQNFVGLDVELVSEHGLSHPIIMDACVEQLSGFRFIYYLPWSPTKLLVEDTRYTEHRDIPVDEWKRGVEELIQSKGWKIKTIERVEVGSLPIPFYDPRPKTDLKNVINLSGIFHDVTGYSIADAFRVCDALSSHGSFRFREVLENYLNQQKNRRRFYRLLNRLMFKASGPRERYRMLEHFYGLPQESIERFYAGTSKRWDRVRIFLGKPPVSVLRAMRVFLSRAEEKL